MKKLWLIFTLMLISSLGLTAQQKETDMIEISGKAEKSIVPDKIFLRIKISEKDIKGSNLTETENTMYRTLQGLGIDTKKNLMVMDLFGDLKPYLIIKSEVVLTKQYELMVPDAKTAAKVCLEMQKLGISDIRLNRTECSKTNEYSEDLRISAIKSAQKKAASLAQAIGQDIGKAIYIREVAYTISNGVKNSVITLRGESSLNASNSNLTDNLADSEIGSIKLSYSVLVRFELK